MGNDILELCARFEHFVLVRFFKYLHAHTTYVTYMQCYLQMPQELQKQNSPILAFFQGANV